MLFSRPFISINIGDAPFLTRHLLEFLIPLKQIYPIKALFLNR